MALLSLLLEIICGSPGSLGVSSNKVLIVEFSVGGFRFGRKRETNNPCWPFLLVWFLWNDFHVVIFCTEVSFHLFLNRKRM